MVVNNNADLDLVLNFRVDDFDYVVFITTDKIKCFGCGNFSHLVRACPSKQVEEDNRSADGTVQTAGWPVKPVEAERTQQWHGRAILMELKALGLRRMLGFSRGGNRSERKCWNRGRQRWVKRYKSCRSCYEGLFGRLTVGLMKLFQNKRLFKVPLKRKKTDKWL